MQQAYSGLVKGVPFCTEGIKLLLFLTRNGMNLEAEAEFVKLCWVINPSRASI